MNTAFYDLGEKPMIKTSVDLVLLLSIANVIIKQTAFVLLNRLCLLLRAFFGMVLVRHYIWSLFITYSPPTASKSRQPSFHTHRHRPPYKRQLRAMNHAFPPRSP